jgi:2-polyprenyl-3-methyl-5-hydroxy-6-metoxy-1,4-benzoquinol methylase
MNRIEQLSSVTDVSMADEWFEYATADHFWMRWRHEMLVRQLTRIGHPISKALDVGCGHGIVRQLVERDFGFPVDGCDLNQHALEKAANGKGRVFVYNIFDRNPALLEAYDLVLLMDVIEHVDDDVGFLSAALEHVKPGGIVAINVPALMACYSKYDEVVGHKRRYNISRIEWLFRQTNIEPLSIVYWGATLLPLLFARKIVVRFVSREQTIHTGFAEHNVVTRNILRMIQRLELSVPFAMPIGTSLMAFGIRSKK